MKENFKFFTSFFEKFLILYSVFCILYSILKFQIYININKSLRKIKHLLFFNIYIGRHVSSVPFNSIIFFPLRLNVFHCGFAGIVSFKNKKKTARTKEDSLEDLMGKASARGYNNCIKNSYSFESDYLGGDKIIAGLLQQTRHLKSLDYFYEIYLNQKRIKELEEAADGLSILIGKETEALEKEIGLIDFDRTGIMLERIENLKDAAWCIKTEVLENIEKVKDLLPDGQNKPSFSTLSLFKKINTVLNSIDRLEVRGRDSAGISLMLCLDKKEFKKFESMLAQSDDNNLFKTYNERITKDILLNQGITVHEANAEGGLPYVAVAFVYKFASEVGSLGDNIRHLRKEIKKDKILGLISTFPFKNDTVFAHTRWASVGAINEPNCHPLDCETCNNSVSSSGIIHVCLNGDIDNYIKLKEKYEEIGLEIYPDITTDTKIIPVMIDFFINQGNDVKEAFRKTVAQFEGSHAITMHTDLASGKLFLAQKGSGQSIFIGLGNDFYMPSSEVYGFVEEMSDFIKIEGEKSGNGQKNETKGQIFILDQNSAGGLEGIEALFYDGTPVRLDITDIKSTKITSRDIDRQGFSHYYLKEISESPLSVEKTLQNRWKIKDQENKTYIVALDEKTIPRDVKDAIACGRIRRIFFIGQGTAGVAAKICADILNYYLNDRSMQISSLKASELSGFKIGPLEGGKTYEDSLVIAISQSGTTTDTNKTVDMVKEQGAYTLAIVNRRDSDLTFKVDGVMYTSTGRDIEMSVASTKAFYSQIVAGALLGLYIAELKGSRNEAFITDEIKQLLDIPEKMKKILSGKAFIEASAKKNATGKDHWAVVGSGPNKAAADEIRIKLSELCYKTISTDYVEDKKHIDLSSEPLIIVCAAGARPNVIGDIIKDTAIFKAHKASPIVITDEDETRFEPYAADVFYIPRTKEHFAPILNTLVGHIWGYYAALTINEGSLFLDRFREDIRNYIEVQAEKGMDIYEVVLDKTFREKLAEFYFEFRKKKSQNQFPAVMGLRAVTDLTLLLKYLSGRLPVSDFELDFGKKGTASNMLNTLFERIGESISCLSRPVDAIKHQAKTVTVGTSRIQEKLEGIVFDVLIRQNLGISQITTGNIVVLKNLQQILKTINGTILYRIAGLNLLGEPTENTSITVIKKTGILATIPSRVETDKKLKGTKRIIVSQQNVYIGKGRKDERSILVIPIISTDPARPNIIEYLLLLNISFKDDVLTETKMKALGGKYEHIKNIVQENSLIWKDEYLDLLKIEELFGRSAEKIGEYIISKISNIT